MPGGETANEQGCPQVAGGLVQGMGDAAHWLDDGSEHPHRIALSVRADQVPHVTHSLQAGIAAAGLQARFCSTKCYISCVMSSWPAETGEDNRQRVWRLAIRRLRVR